MPSPELKTKYLPKMVTGEWTGTMNLTEPHCGTDLGLLRTKAVKQADGSYKITGTKIFISAGEHDLGRKHHPPGAGAHRRRARRHQRHLAVRGAEDHGQGRRLARRDRNGVSCGSIEEKMGIHGNSTCVMNYDGATGWLIGQENRGLNAMFTMMNEARLGVGVQGLAQSEVAYQNAAIYAKERLQGRALSGAKYPDKPADPIIVHPDVRRTLMTIRSFNEAARALVLWTALKGDIAHRSQDQKERQGADDFMGLLTPVVKGVLTDTGFANTVMAQQMFGGHGYIAEHGMEQFVRDARIAQIYEGANGIQALDLVGRKLGKDGGRALMAFHQRSRLLHQGKERRRRHEAFRHAARRFARPSAAGFDVVHAERHGQARQCRRRGDRLSAHVRPGGARLHVVQDRRSRARQERQWRRAAHEAPSSSPRVSSWSACCRRRRRTSPASSRAQAASWNWPTRRSRRVRTCQGRASAAAGTSRSTR